jgi:hypothetical protein
MYTYTPPPELLDLQKILASNTVASSDIVNQVLAKLDAPGAITLILQYPYILTDGGVLEQITNLAQSNNIVLYQLIENKDVVNYPALITAILNGMEKMPITALTVYNSQVRELPEVLSAADKILSDYPDWKAIADSIKAENPPLYPEPEPTPEYPMQVPLAPNHPDPVVPVVS